MKDLKIKRVYLIAIAGSGMSALAGLFKQSGCEVAGSDLACFSPTKDLLDELGVEVRIGYDVEHLQAFRPDFVVIGNFVRRDNPQAQFVIDHGIPYDSLPGSLENFFLKETQNFVFVGTHGKSTSTSFMAHLLRELQLQPGFLIGAVPNNLKRSFESGAGKYFVIEGDEYDTAFFDKESKFLHYRPTWGIWTSLEYDHADIFPSMERLEDMFLKFLAKISPQGGLIYCRDWERVHELSSSFKGQKWSYGFHPESDFRIENYRESGSGMSFQLRGQEFTQAMTGQFNAQNFVGGLVACLQIPGTELTSLAAPLRSFAGLKRRQEVKFEKLGRRVIDDFAHHPTAVKSVIHSIKKKYPDQAVVVIFEARSNTSRRNIFQKEFAEAFEGADYVFLPEVFKREALAGSEALNISEIISSLQKKGRKAYGPLSHDEILERSAALAKQEEVSFLLLSNGSFDGLHQRLISRLESLYFDHEKNH